MPVGQGKTSENNMKPLVHDFVRIIDVVAAFVGALLVLQFALLYFQ